MMPRDVTAGADTRGRMNRFLDAFDDKVTIHTLPGDVTHRSLDDGHSSSSGPRSRGPHTPAATPIVGGTTMEGATVAGDDGVRHRHPAAEGAATAPLLAQAGGEMASRFSVIRAADLSPAARTLYDHYRSHGYALIPHFVAADDVAALQSDSRQIMAAAAFGENAFYGTKTKRSYSILAKSRSLDRALSGDIFHELLAAFFAPNALLSALQMIEIFPGEVPQKLHYDQQFTNQGLMTRGEDDVINFIVAIDDFTSDNGGTVLVPGSHRWPAERTPTVSDERFSLTMPAGTACMFSGNLWHGGGGAHHHGVPSTPSSSSRRAIIAAMCQPWLRPLENHFLAVPFHVAAELPVRLQGVLGYSLHHPFVGQVDFGHPRKKLLALAEEQRQDRQQRSRTSSKI